MLNWAVELGYIQHSPISKIRKPKRLQREIYYTSDQWELICSHVTDGFIDLLDFLWSTGCRPKEARDLEARHSYATHGLTNGVDSVVLAQLMGHSNTNMIANVYSHLSQNPQFLLEQAKRVKKAS